MVEAWLDDGGDVDARSEGGPTLLMIAAARGREPIVEMLFRRKATVDLQTRYYGLTALLCAALYGHTAVVRRLLAAGGHGAA